MIRLVDWLSERFGGIGAWLVVPLFLIMGYQAFAWLVYDQRIMLTYEFAAMITGAHFALGIAYVTKNRQHFRVDFLYARFPFRARAAIDCFVYIGFLLPLAGWLTWRLGVVALEVYRSGEVSGDSLGSLPVWPLRSVVALGFALFGLQILAEGVRNLRVALGRPEHLS